MTAFTTTPENLHGLRPAESISPRHRVLLNISLDYLMDASRARTLGQALGGSDPLDVMRMLAQQWSRGLSTLSGDLEQPHEIFIKPSVAAQFIEGVRAVLEADPQLAALPANPKAIYGELVRHMAKNQPFHAAWCAAMLWQHPVMLN